MPLPNGTIDVITNPLKISPFIQNWSIYSPSPPPGTDRMITELNGDPMITQTSGEYMITETK